MASRKHKEWLKRRRLELYLDEDVKADLKAMSEELGVSQSQIVQFYLMTGMRDTRSLSKYLEKSEAPMWEHKINFDRLKRDLGID